MIILTTLNARYTHTSLALRCLIANLAELEPQAQIMEFVINEDLCTIAEKILAKSPKIIAIGAYIWNASDISRLLEILKTISPETTIVLGGPEASHEPFRVDFSLADFIIQGEGEIAFYELCSAILQNKPPTQRIIKAKTPEIKSLKLPYSHYTDEDIKHRYTYFESSRGCPYECEFCLSSIDEKVRYYETDEILSSLEMLYQKGARRFKFIDRTFNLNITIATKILDFFLAKDNQYFVHFEVIPENFPESLRSRLKLFSPGSLQLEIGIQTLNPKIAKNINRSVNIEKIKDNIMFLSSETSAHLHFDLIVGLPGEDVESFATSLNSLSSITNSEIQVGILKKLSGTTMNRHDEAYGMIYSKHPPYEILQNNMLDFKTMQKMKRFARFWDIVYNSGNFDKTVRMLFSTSTPFESFFAFCEWVYDKTESTWQISLDRMSRLLFEYMTEVLTQEKKTVAQNMIDDITKSEGRRTPAFLKDVLKN